MRAASRVAPKIERLAGRARRRGVPVIYVNDNFGRWRSDFKSTVAISTKPGQPGREIAMLLRPHEGDYFVLKPQHSGFYGTALEPLLQHLGTRCLVLTGFAGNLCVLFTANDAHMRGYQVVVPSDCTASNTPALTRSALTHVEVALHGDVRTSNHVDFARLSRQPRKPRGQTF